MFKAKHVFYILTLSILVISSCREITITTKVNKDGTFTRILRITGDSSEVLLTGLPFPVNGTWARVIEKDTAVEGGFVATYTKTYSNSDELNAEISADTSWQRNLDREVTVIKRFGFFYSYLKFRQVFHAENPFDSLDYNDYLTKEDLLWISGMKPLHSSADSNRKEEAEEKANVYYSETIAAEIESELAGGIRSLRIPDLSPDDVKIYHDSIISLVGQWDFDITEIIEHYSKWTGRVEVMKLNELSPSPFEDLQAKMETLMRIIIMEDYLQVVQMPGLITETNSVALKGNQVSWQFIPLSVLFEGYEMYVESRILNMWAFVVTGMVILILIIVTVIKAFRSR